MNAHPYIPPDWLEERTAKLADDCLGRGNRRYSSVDMVSRQALQGHFRTARSVAREITPDPPRPYLLDDPPGSIDLGSLNARPIGEQVVMQSLRCRQRVYEAELNFVLLVDASRSMLARDPSAHGEHVKLARLFEWAAAFLSVAGWARFHMHVLAGNEYCLEGPLRGRDSRRLLTGTLFDLLPRALKTANAANDECEPAAVRALIEAELCRKRRGVAVIVSDFLDDADSYQAALMRLAATHRIVLVDVATRLDRHVSSRWWEFNARKVPVLEGARHMEAVFGPMPISSDNARRWNAEQEENLRVLAGMESPGVIRRLVVDSDSKDAAESSPDTVALRTLKQLS